MEGRSIKNALFGVTTQPFAREPVAVEEDPKVRELSEALALASGELTSLKVDEQKLQTIVDPPPQESHQALPSVLPEDFYDAQARLPGVRAQRQRTAGQVQRLEKQLREAREAARRDFDEGRRELRKPLVAAVFDKFREAVDENERLIAFDKTTGVMGGSQSSLPCPGLHADVYEYQRGLAEKDGWL